MGSPLDAPFTSIYCLGKQYKQCLPKQINVLSVYLFVYCPRSRVPKCLLFTDKRLSFTKQCLLFTRCMRICEVARTDGQGLDPAIWLARECLATGSIARTGSCRGASRVGFCHARLLPLLLLSFWTCDSFVCVSCVGPLSRFSHLLCPF